MHNPFTLIVALALALLALPAGAENIVYPDDAGVVNIKTQYGAKGDGVTDDTAAIQKAVDEKRGTGSILYFPNGTYMVTDGVGIFGGKPHSRDRFLTYQGQSEAGAVIRLKDKSPAFQDPAKSKIVLSVYEGQGTGDVMQSYVNNLTVDVGKGNPGAVGLRYLSNNVGAMRNVTIRSSDPNGAGVLGLDLRQGQQGPSLITHVTVIGFDTGVQTADTFSLVFEHLTLKGQRKLGFLNPYGRVTIRGLKSVNSVPVVQNNKDSNMTLIEGDFTGGDRANTAITSGGHMMFLRDIKQQGYGHLLKDSKGKFVDGATLDEWHEGQAVSLFGAPLKSLRLPIKETPEVVWDADVSKWQRVDNSQDDDTENVQKAFDDAAKAGKTTVYFPKDREGSYHIHGPIRVHGSVNRIEGMANMIDVRDPEGTIKESALFTFEDLTSPAIVVERVFIMGGWKGPLIDTFANKSKAAVVIRNMGIAGSVKAVNASGEWFIDDVSPGRPATLKVGKGEKVWCRQFNPESFKADMIDVDGGQLWILGFKTEGRATHLVARNGAKVEILGGVAYQSWGNQPLNPPMFKISDSDVSITIGFYHYKDPFETIVEETIGENTRTLKRTELPQYYLPIYRSGRGG